MGVPEEELPALAGPVDSGTSAPLAGIPVDVVLDGAGGDLPGPSGWSWVLAEGHAPGHLMLFESEDRLLLAGDQFLVRWKTPYRVADPEEDAFGRYLASLDAAIGLEPAVVCSSHTAPVRPALPWLRDRRDALRRQAERTREAASAGAVSAWDIMLSRPGPPGLRILLLREQLAILRHLAATGELVRRLEGPVERFEPA
jgi:glyoxylase-like metal-dependent hydrolase (beta-lactamase superfamily II)